MPIGTYTMLKGKEPSFGKNDTKSAFYYAYGPGNGAVSKYGKISGVITLPEKVRLVGTGEGRNASFLWALQRRTVSGVLILALGTVEPRIISPAKKQQTQGMVGIRIASNLMQIKVTTSMVWRIRISQCRKSTLLRLLLDRQNLSLFPMLTGKVSNSL